MPAYKDEKTGKWFAKFYYTNWQGIKKQKWKRGFATKKEALGFERDFLEKQSANPDMTFQNLYEIYMEDMAARLKQSTLLTKKTVLQTHILPFFGSKPINEIKFINHKDQIRCYPVQDGESLARYLVQEVQLFGEVHPDLLNHIDYAAIGRELEASENYLFTDNGIFSYR